MTLLLLLLKIELNVSASKWTIISLAQGVKSPFTVYFIFSVDV